MNEHFVGFSGSQGPGLEGLHMNELRFNVAQ